MSPNLRYGCGDAVWPLWRLAECQACFGFGFADSFRPYHIFVLVGVCGEIGLAARTARLPSPTSDRRLGNMDMARHVIE